MSTYSTLTFIGLLHLKEAFRSSLLCMLVPLSVRVKNNRELTVPITNFMVGRSRRQVEDRANERGYKNFSYDRSCNNILVEFRLCLIAGVVRMVRRRLRHSVDYCEELRNDVDYRLRE